jgi:hypothetical protein
MPGDGYGREMAMLPEDFDFVSTGWIRLLPEPAMNAYLAIWGLDRHPSGAVAGDLDGLGARALTVEEFGGLDTVYNPAAHGDIDSEVGEMATWTIRWSEFGQHAAQRGLPMSTSRDAIEFMRAIGLVERVEENDEIFWRPMVPVPLAEDVLELDEQTREREAAIRWQSAFQQANNRVTGWLVELRTDALTTELTTTPAELAGRTDLDVDEVRHGLAARDAGDRGYRGRATSRGGRARRASADHRGLAALRLRAHLNSARRPGR